MKKSTSFFDIECVEPNGKTYIVAHGQNKKLVSIIQNLYQNQKRKNWSKPRKK